MPTGLFSLPTLKFLDLSHNLLGSPKHPGSCLSEAIGQCQSLVELHLAGNLLQQLPESIGDLANLEILNAKDNKLAALPQRIGLLDKLIKLNLDGNCITVIPASLGNLAILRDLSIAKNKVREIESDCLSNLEALVMLDLHQNCFRDFSAVPRSSKLDTISLGYNQLTTLSNLESAPNLSVLDLHSNKLVDLPLSIMNMNSLKTLTVSNNELKDINPRIALLEELVRLNIEGNPLKAIKPAMRSANAVQLKKYLKMRLGEDEVE